MKSGLAAVESEARKMETITDEFMRQMISRAKGYCIVVLRPGPKIDMDAADKVVWEHGRSNFRLRAEGKLAIVCPIRGAKEIEGIGIFTTELEETRRMMDDDPGVKAGLFTYEAYPCRSFPGDCLP